MNSIAKVAAVAGATLLILGGLTVLGRGCIPVGGPTEREALEWAHKMNLKPIGVDCTSFDTDGDGYVSCTLALPGAASSTGRDVGPGGGDTGIPGGIDLQPVECAHPISLNSGCRVPKAVIRQGSAP